MNDQETAQLPTGTNNGSASPYSNATFSGTYALNVATVPSKAPATNGTAAVPSSNGHHASTSALAEAGAGVTEIWHHGIDWPVVVWIGLVHVLALVAPFFFSWQALLVCAFLIIVTGAMGVCMGYHRCLTHGSF